MRRRSLPLLVPVLAIAAACSDSADAPRVSVSAHFTMPRALLDRVTQLTLTVLEGDATCDPLAGAVTRGATVKELLSKKPLGSTGCAAGARYCGDVVIDKSDLPRVFSAIGTGDANAEIATGCTTATVNQDSVPLAIKMVRYLAPAVCGDGVVEPTEQCEPGGSVLCDATCQTNELLLSVGGTQNGTSNGAPGDKTDPAFLWPTGTGAAGWFFAFYTDRATGTSNNADVSMRVMSEELVAVASPPAPVAFTTASLFLPNGSNGGNLPSTPSPRQQSLPAAALLSGKIWVAFQDDDTPPGPNGLDVHLRSMDAHGVADQGLTPLGVNGASGAGEANIQGAPALAASGGKLFVAWEDQGQGKISGRSVTPPSTLGSQNDISTGTGNTHVSLAPTASGWISVWQSGTGIKLRAINADGTPSGAEQAVTEGAAAADKPRVASLDDGRFAVAWTAGGDVFFQRYDAQGAKIPGDQSAALNDVVTAGTQSSVAIAGTPAAGGSFVVAWLDESTGHVRARMLGGSSGFLFNNVNGQASEFQASRTDGHTRATPTIASGGSAPYVAIGWADQTAPGAGIVARRFPLPAQ